MRKMENSTLSQLCDATKLSGNKAHNGHLGRYDVISKAAPETFH